MRWFKNRPERRSDLRSVAGSSLRRSIHRLPCGFQIQHRGLFSGQVDGGRDVFPADKLSTKIFPRTNLRTSGLRSRAQLKFGLSRKRNFTNGPCTGASTSQLADSLRTRPPDPAEGQGFGMDIEIPMGR